MRAVSTYSALGIGFLSAACMSAAWSQGPGALGGSAEFTFDDIAEMTTCNPATITWTAVPIPSTIASVAGFDLSITNSGVSQPPPPSSSAAITHSARSWGGSHPYVRATITRDIAHNIDASTGSFTWTTVNVTTGWYSVIATFSDVFGLPPEFGPPPESAPFFVANGADTSCLVAASSLSISSTASHTTPSSTSVSPSPTSVTGTGRQVAKFPSGAIAGIVVGAILVLGAMIMVILRARFRKKPSHIAPFLPLYNSSDALVYALPNATRNGPLRGHTSEKTAHVLDSATYLDNSSPQIAGSAIQPQVRALDAQSGPGGDGGDGTSDRMTQQLRAMAERVALVEARVETFAVEQPPDYSDRD
ncbi:hypothetical protein B0H12DRAFT_827979 [Mycena haematopus]|nr:hypothetical protein B0H12DRAFT_827979 [Mycena haematopus]